MVMICEVGWIFLEIGLNGRGSVHLVPVQLVPVIAPHILEDDRSVFFNWPTPAMTVRFTRPHDLYHF